MVQVDVFWSYGLASGLALAASKQLAKEPDPWDNRYFPLIVLWLAVFFAPSGAYLLWEFPGWETMYVAGSRDDIPAWLVALFAATNVTQGVLGYWVTYRYIRKGKMGAARLQCIWSHAAMLFILFVGWDGRGFARFTHTGTREEFLAGITNPWYEWLWSPVAFTLMAMGAVLIPTYAWLCRRWATQA